MAVLETIWSWNSKENCNKRLMNWYIEGKRKKGREMNLMENVVFLRKWWMDECRNRKVRKECWKRMFQRQAKSRGNEDGGNSKVKGRAVTPFPTSCHLWSYQVHIGCWLGTYTALRYRNFCYFWVAICTNTLLKFTGKIIFKLIP